MNINIVSFNVIPTNVFSKLQNFAERSTWYASSSLCDFALRRQCPLYYREQETFLAAYLLNMEAQHQDWVAFY